ncbi:MAG: hypothetical protein CMF69_07120 [Magnetovibrio sp.]|nr:hypothetical protein [Magnetovibrio sp.]|tara:strand:+ start:569 stop:919 length:351 start_codon:yes stop_codon:yes gene_type:complete
MQSSNRILDDLARVANGAVSTLAGAKDEIDALIRQKIESCLVDADLVPKEDFEVVKLMAAEARLEQERLSKRVGALEKRIKSMSRDKSSPTRKIVEAKKTVSTRRKRTTSRSKKTS